MTLTELKRICPPLPSPKDSWRTMPEVSGGVNGLDHVFRGVAIATNGIMVAIMTPIGIIVFGHLDFFVKDKKEEDGNNVVVRPRKAAKEKSLQQLEEFYD